MRKWLFIVLLFVCVPLFLFIDRMLFSAEHSYLSTNLNSSVGSGAKKPKSSLGLPFTGKNEQTDKSSAPPFSTSQKQNKSLGQTPPPDSLNKQLSTNSWFLKNSGNKDVALTLPAEFRPPPSSQTPKKPAPVFIAGADPAVFFTIRFVNEQVLPHNRFFKKTKIGGLSALSYDPEADLFLALSDDKGNKGGAPRFYKFQLKQDPENKKYKLEPVDLVFLTNRNGQSFSPIDPEGIVFFKPDRIFISSEGAQMPDLTAPPALFTFSGKGKLISSWLPSGVYWPDDPARVGTYGVRENKGFEALSLDSENNQLYTATESALHQDEQEKGNKQYVRISRFDIETQKITSQVIYPMSADIELEHLKGSNGLTDFIVLGENKLLTVERAYLKDESIAGERKTDANQVRLFLTDCSKAGNVLPYKDLRKGRFVTCGKRLIADLSSLLGDRLDNIEGISIGPEVAGGNHLLVLVSDNNFRSAQKTQFLFFHYSPRSQYASYGNQ